MHKCNNAVTNGGTLLGITCSSVPSFYASLGKTHKYANTRMNSIILFQRTYNTPGTTLLTVHLRFLFQKNTALFMVLPPTRTIAILQPPPSGSGQWQPSGMGMRLNNKQHIEDIEAFAGFQ
jgi:hypothetical protein